MNILVACEESQAVTIELRKLGHEAYSCDIEPCSGGHPEWHLQQDVIPLLSESWDMILAFPPCTHLAVSGARYFEEKRRDGRQQQAMEFFMRFVTVDCEKVAIENPIGIMSTRYRKPDQIIQPYEYGHAERKSTCLWLKGLPKLVPTDIVRPELHICGNGVVDSKWHYHTYNLPPKERAKMRSKTFLGIAKAMAEQWAGKWVKNLWRDRLMTQTGKIIVGFIIGYYKENQFYPNYDEIAEAINRTKSTVHTHMRRLEDEGVIIRKADHSSQYRLINMGFICKNEGG